MSLYGALLTGVSSLNANGRALSITSSNIANVNTVGYKTSTADFSTFLASTGSANVVTPSSVQVNAVQHLTQQGLLTSTASSTDLAITGNGFFIVTPTPANPLQTYYTRAGSFTADSDGLLRNAAGFYLEGWTLNPDGSMPANRSSLWRDQPPEHQRHGGSHDPDELERQPSGVLGRRRRLCRRRHVRRHGHPRIRSDHQSVRQPGRRTADAARLREDRPGCLGLRNLLPGQRRRHRRRREQPGQLGHDHIQRRWHVGRPARRRRRIHSAVGRHRPVLSPSR